MLFKWHIVDEEYHLPPPSVNFDNIKSHEIPYQVGNSAQLAKLDQFARDLDLRDYEPKKSYEDLKLVHPKPLPMFITHTELFVHTATLLELTAEGLLSNGTFDRPPPMGILPNDFYRCCGYYYNHPGCYVGPIKYKITKWKLVPDDFAVKIWTTRNISKLWNSPISGGTYHLTDPTEIIMDLKRKLTDGVIRGVERVKSDGAGDPTEDLGIEFYMLQEYGEVNFGNRNLPQSPPGPPGPPEEELDPPPGPLDTTLPEDSSDSEGADSSVVINYVALLNNDPNFSKLKNIHIPEIDDNLNILLNDSNNFGAYSVLRNYLTTRLSVPWGIGPANSPAFAKYSTLNYFKWDDNSCWYDSILTCLFSIPGSAWERQIRDSYYIDRIVDDLMIDIQTIQGFDKGKTAISMKYFKSYGPNAFESPSDALEKMIGMFNLGNQVDYSLPFDRERTFSFISAIHADDNASSSTAHFVSYVRQPDRNWIRFDGHDPIQPIEFVDNISERINGSIRIFKEIEQGMDGTETIIERKRYEQPALFFAKDNLEKVDLTPIDIFNHWKNVRNYLGMIQPVYLSEKRQKDRITTPNKIPWHNAEIYNGNPQYIYRDVMDGKIEVTDKGSENGYEIEFKEPEGFKKNAKTLVSLFNANIMDITNPEIFVYVLIPEYEAMVRSRTLLKSDKKTDFDAEGVLLPLIKVRNDVMNGKVIQI